MPDTSLIMLFVKAPLRGQVKSRLAAALGKDAALELYRNFVLDILASIEKIGAPCRVCYYPPGSGEVVKNWLGGHLMYIPQEGNDIGERMERAFRQAFSEGASRAILIGSDIPDLPPPLLQDAVERLERTGAVIGPAMDGGYYLIGFRKDSFLPNVFSGPEWSTDTVFADTTAIFERSHQQFFLLPMWRDMDTVEDLKDLVSRNMNSGFSDSKTMHCLSSQNIMMNPAEVSDAEV